jgi:hypothetical protein
LLVAIVAVTEADHLGVTLALAQSRDRFVDDDAHEPCGKLRIATKACERAVGDHPGLLHRVLRLRVVAKNAARRAVELLVVAAASGQRRRHDAPALIRPSNSVSGTSVEGAGARAVCMVAVRRIQVSGLRDIR